MSRIIAEFFISFFRWGDNTRADVTDSLKEQKRLAKARIFAEVWQARAVHKARARPSILSTLRQFPASGAHLRKANNRFQGIDNEIIKNLRQFCPIRDLSEAYLRSHNSKKF